MEALTKAIDESIAYSYQQNLQKVGLPQKNERETAEETRKLAWMATTLTLTLLIEIRQETRMVGEDDATQLFANL